MPDRFKWMEMSEAAKECSTQRQQTGANCGTCQMRVILHCSTCKIQVTACLCSTIDKWGEDEAFKRMVEQFGEEMTRSHYQRLGIVVPQTPKILLPGEE